MKSFIKDLVITAVLALIMYAGVHAALQQIVVQQVSMFPNLQEGQRIFINKVAYFFHKPERGDIVVFRTTPGEGEMPLIKRVIGLPGEIIEIHTGTVFVNGSPLEEPYIREQPGYTLQRYAVPAGQYFVLGDNRNLSHDSHEGWAVSEENIIGKAWVSVWPPETWGLVPGSAYAR